VIGSSITGEQVSYYEDKQAQIQMKKIPYYFISRLTRFQNNASAAGTQHPQYLGYTAPCQWILIGQVTKGERNADAIKVFVGKGKVGSITIGKRDISFPSQWLCFSGSYLNHGLTVIKTYQFYIVRSQLGYINHQVTGATAQVKHFLRL